MKNKSLLSLITLTLILTFSGCQRKPKDMWEDTKSAGHYMGRGFRSLGGKQGDSRQVANSGDFKGHSDEDFIPLENSDLGRSVYASIPQPAMSPGDPGSSIPSIDSFQNPDQIPGLASIFKRVHFATNEHTLRSQEDFDNLRQIAQYLKKHPHTYIFAEGHCDERGTAAYNLSLGTRRSNAVRNFLIQEGVDLNQIYTISYGKERPLALGHSPKDWRENRRVQYKVFEKQTEE